MKQSKPATPDEPVTEQASPPPTQDDQLRAVIGLCEHMFAEFPEESAAKMLSQAIQCLAAYLMKERAELLSRIATLQADVERERRSSTLVLVPEKAAVQP